MPNLPNEDREKRFVATGPNQGFTVRGLTGFYTDATKLEFGVNAQGNQCGVYGESVTDDTGRTLPDPADGQSVRTGVCGVGRTYGVFGDGSQVAGVYGQHEANGAGVIGVGRKEGVTGVIGASRDPRRASSRKKSSGIGVKGASNSGQGFGVVGVSVKDLAIGSNPVAGLPDGDGDGTGVMGSSGTGTGVRGVSTLGTGVVGTGITGVEGHGGLSAGVVGKSAQDRGGKFQSGDDKHPGVRPQLNLVPHPMQPKGGRIDAKPEKIFVPTTKSLPLLPLRGSGGDFLVTEDTQGACTLWFCVKANDDVHDTLAQWSQVMMGEAVSGRRG